MYARVNIPEQNPAAFLQRQEEKLRLYCANNAIEPGGFFIDQCSARTFERQGWQCLINALNHANGKPDLILFTTWDRFSRNAADGLETIKCLNNMGIEVLAVEQNGITSNDNISSKLLKLFLGK